MGRMAPDRGSEVLVDIQSMETSLNTLSVQDDLNLAKTSAITTPSPDGAYSTPPHLSHDPATNAKHADLETIWGGAFEISDLDVDRRLIVNRQRRIKMYRCWIQGRFRKRDQPH